MIGLFMLLILALPLAASCGRNPDAYNICRITERPSVYDYNISFALTTSGTCSNLNCNIFNFFRKKMRFGGVIDAHHDPMTFGCDCELSAAVTATGQKRHLFRFPTRSPSDCSSYRCWDRYAQFRGALELPLSDSALENRLNSDYHWKSECASNSRMTPDVQMESVDEVIVRQPKAGFWSKWKLVQDMVDLEELPSNMHRRQVVHYKGAKVIIHNTTVLEHGDAGIVVGPVKGDRSAVVVKFNDEHVLMPLFFIEAVEMQPSWEGFELQEQVYYVGSVLNFGCELTPLRYGQVGHVIGGSGRPGHVAVEFSGLQHRTELPGRLLSTESPPKQFPSGLSLGDSVYLSRHSLVVPGYGTITRGHKGVIVEGNADPTYVGVMFDSLPTVIEMKGSSVQTSPVTEEASITNIILSKPLRIRESDVDPMGEIDFFEEYLDGEYYYSRVETFVSE